MTSHIKLGLMAQGAYEVDFRGMPDLVDEFITGRHLLFYRGAELYAAGVILEPLRDSDQLQLAGPGLEWWNGEDDKHGNIRLPKTYAGLRTDQIVDDLLYREDATRPINPGVLNVGNVIDTFSIAYESASAAIRRLAFITKTVYRYNPDLTFDWAGNLTPQAFFALRNLVLSADAGTVEGDVTYKPSAFNVVTRATALGKGEGDAIIVATSDVIVDPAWKDGNNNPFQRGMVIDAPNAQTLQETQFVADGQAGLHNTERVSAEATLASADLLGEFVVGDTVYVHVPLLLEDPANAIAYRGNVYPALAVLVTGADIEMGSDWRCTIRRPDGTELDVTNDVQWASETKATVKLAGQPDKFYDTGLDPTQTMTDARRVSQSPEGAGPDNTVPAAPAGLTLASQSYKDSEHKTRTRLLADWTAVTQNTDASAIDDLDGYVVRYRQTTMQSIDPWETQELTLPAKGWWGRWWIRDAGTYNVIDQNAHPDVDQIYSQLDITNANPGVTANINARFEAQVVAPSSGNFTFYVLHDDGVRVWVNGVLKIDQWVDGGGVTHQFVMALVAGATYTVVIEHYNRGGPERLKVEWQGPGVARALLSGPGAVVVSGPTSHALITNLPPGLQWEAQVAARDKSGNQSVWGPEIPVATLSATDTTPPPQPQTPTVAGGIEVLYVNYNRLDAVGAAMPNDVRWYEVHVGASSGFVPDAATLKSETQSTLVTVSGLAAGTYYVKLVAVDFANNKSAASVAATGTVRLVTSTDVASQGINGGNIADGAISMQKMASGLRPPIVVASLPALPDSNYPQGQTVFLTSDNQLYRSTGSAWTKSIAAVDLTGQITTTQIADNSISTPKLQADSVTASIIQANAVGTSELAANSVVAGKIAAGAVAADKLVVGNFDNLVEDPGTERSAAGVLGNARDGSSWYTDAGADVSIVADASNSRSGGKAMRRTYAGAASTRVMRNNVELDCRPGDEFYIETFVKTLGGGTGTGGAAIEWLDSTRAVLSRSDLVVSAPGGTYTIASGTATAPANAVYARSCRVVVSQTAGDWWIDDTWMLKTTISAYISALAVTTAKLADLAVTTAKIALLAVGTAQIADLAVTNAKINDLVANKISTGSLLATIDITSGILRTASSGRRIELVSSGQNFYTTSGAANLSGSEAARWWRDAAGDAKPFGALWGYYDAGQSGVNIRSRRYSDAILGYAAIDVTNADEVSRRSTLQLTVDSAGREEVGIYGSASTWFAANSSFDATKKYITKLAGPVRVTGAGIIYENGNTVSSGTTLIPGAGKSWNVGVSYDTPWPSTSDAPSVIITARSGSVRNIKGKNYFGAVCAGRSSGASVTGATITLTSLQTSAAPVDAVYFPMVMV